MKINKKKINCYSMIKLPVGGFTVVGIILFIILVLTVPQGSSEPNNFEFDEIVIKADRLFWTGELDSVEKYGNLLVQRFPDESEGYRFLCMYWISENDWNKSIKWGKKAVKKDKYSGLAHHWLGRAYASKARNSSRFRAAFLIGDVKKHFLKAAELIPDYIRTHEDLFNFYVSSPGIAGGSTEKAEEELEHIEKLDAQRGADLKIHYYLRKERDDLAEIEIEKTIALDSTDIDRRWKNTHILITIKSETARKHLRYIMQIAPEESLKVFYELGKTYFWDEDSFQKGIEIFTKYISSEDANKSPRYATSFWRRGMLYEKIGEYEKALLDYEETSKRKPTFNPVKKVLEGIKEKIEKQQKK